MPIIRSISGLRATAETNATPNAEAHQYLSPQLFARYSYAYATVAPSGPIVVGNDGRSGFEPLEQAVIETLQMCGRNVIHLGTVPTPTVQLLTEHSEAAGGIILTASHNPAQWNGLKFLSNEGVFLSQAKNQELWDVVDGLPDTWVVPSTGGGSYTKAEHALQDHIKRILALPEMALLETQPMKGTVVVDAVNASGSVVVPQLLRMLGFDVVELFCDGSGVFPHKPEPLSENLEALSKEVIARKAVMGVAVDPDADRLVLIDETGAAIGEEKTIVLASWAALEHAARQHGSSELSVVVNLSSSMMINTIAERYNARIYRSAVGEINVVEKMKSTQAIIGGEGSGGVIYPACHMGRDSLVGIALVCLCLAQQRVSLRECAANLPQMVMLKQAVVVPPTFRFDRHNLLKVLLDGTVDTTDGLHVVWQDSWVHIRCSNTEPIVRCIVEAPTLQAANHRMEQALTAVHSCA
jgi:phosphomannomutase